MFAGRSPAIAATASFLLPGLGQLSLGAVRRAAVVAAPAILAVVVVALKFAQATDMDLADLVLDPATLTFLLVANVVLAGYHLVAIADAWLIGVRRGTGRPGRVAVGVLVVLVAMTVGLHGYVEYLGIDANTTLDAIFLPGDDGDASEGVIPPASFDDEASAEPDISGESAEPGESATPDGSAGPSPTDASSSPGGSATPAASGTLTEPPTATPSPTPTPRPVPAWAKDGRLNLLLVGADAGPDRWSLRTDTMILLSVSVKSGRAALFGIPRNLTGVPLAPESAAAVPGGRFPGMLNALYVYAMGHPNKFPGGANRGYRAVAGAVQELVGVPLDGMVVVNLAGFVRLVDELGGLWIDIPERLHDSSYPLEDGSGLITIDFAPGCQHLSGRMALAYARSRHQDSDYGRMHRQQDVLLALRRQLDPVELAPRVPRLLQIARDNLWTTLKRSDVKDMAKLAERVNVRRIRTVFFTPSAYPEHLDKASIARIRSVVRGALTGPLPPLAPLPSGKACR
jgi:LCP family protein required for cell wall assembly